MNSIKMEENSLPIHSLIRDRRRAFAELIRAFLKFNVPSAKKIEVHENGSISINDQLFKVDISDYTGVEEGFGYIFFNPSNGRLLLENKNVKKIYKLDVDLLDNND
jgi:hypothetical protein